MKKRGFGNGHWNGFGGKVKEGESIEHAAIRELEEEAGVVVQPSSLKKSGELSFYFPHKPEWNQVVHVYVIKEWVGKPQESEEMRPEWFSPETIPFTQMWDDDKYWLPKVLNGGYIRATFVFDEAQKVKEYRFS